MTFTVLTRGMVACCVDGALRSRATSAALCNDCMTELRVDTELLIDASVSDGDGTSNGRADMIAVCTYGAATLDGAVE